MNDEKKSEKQKVYKYTFFGNPSLMMAKNKEEAKKKICDFTGDPNTKIEELPEGCDLKAALLKK